MKSTVMILGLALLTPALAMANEKGQAHPSAYSSAYTSTTAKLLAAQRSGELASQQDQHLSGKARKEIYLRYVKSFSHAIPETYIDESFKSE